MQKLNANEVLTSAFWKNLKDKVNSSIIKGKTMLSLNPKIFGKGKTSCVFRIQDLNR